MIIETEKTITEEEITYNVEEVLPLLMSPKVEYLDLPCCRLILQSTMLKYGLIGLLPGGVV